MRHLRGSTPHPIPPSRTLQGTCITSTLQILNKLPEVAPHSQEGTQVCDRSEARACALHPRSACLSHGTCRAGSGLPHEH